MPPDLLQLLQYGRIFKVRLGKRIRNCHSQASGFPRDHGMSVAPFGRFPSVRDSLTGSLATRIIIIINYYYYYYYYYIGFILRPAYANISGSITMKQFIG